VLNRWLLPVVFGALVFKLSVWCGAEGCVSSLRAAAATALVFKLSVWCGAEGYVSSLRAAGATARKPDT
jgi:hypothetical protein